MDQTHNNQVIDWVFVLILLGLSPFFLFPTIATSPLFFVFPLMWLYKRKKVGRFIEPTMLDLALILLLFQVFLASVTAPDPLPSMPKISGILFGVFLFYALLAVLKKELWIKIGIMIFLLSGIAVSLVGVLDMIRTDKYLDPIDAATALIPKLDYALPGTERGINPNLIGGSIVLVVPLFLILIYPFLRKQNPEYGLFRSRWYLPYLSVGLIVTLSVLILTQSRGSWIGMVVCADLYLLSKGKTGRRIGILVLVGFILAYLILLGPTEIGKGLSAASRSALNRIDLWTIAVHQIEKKPITGMGLNYYRRLPETGYDKAHAHNILLHTAAELGMPALLAYLAILIAAGYMCVVVWIKAKDGWKKLTVLGLGAGLLAHFIWGMGDALALGAKTGAVFWMSLALITALYNFELHGRGRLQANEVFEEKVSEEEQ
ncbi:O-antigen ligase family protein [Acidobacteriota bacterium]